MRSPWFITKLVNETSCFAPLMWIDELGLMTKWHHRLIRLCGKCFRSRELEPVHCIICRNWYCCHQNRRHSSVHRCCWIWGSFDEIGIDAFQSSWGSVIEEMVFQINIIILGLMSKRLRIVSKFYWKSHFVCSTIFLSKITYLLWKGTILFFLNWIQSMVLLYN